jgi:hypothetical protein
MARRIGTMSFFDKVGQGLGHLGHAIVHPGEDDRGEQANAAPTRTEFSQQGPIPPVSTTKHEHQPSASERAFGFVDNLFHHGTAEAKQPGGSATAGKDDDARVDRSGQELHMGGVALHGHAVPAGRMIGDDWTTLLARTQDNKTASASVAPEDHTKLVDIAAYRRANLAGELKRLGGDFEVSSNPHTSDWQGTGWQHTGDHTAGYTAHDNAQDRMLQLALDELFNGTDSKEGYYNGIVTYDGTISVGSGWANSAQGGEAGMYVARWLASDPGPKQQLLHMGFAVAPNNTFAVVDDGGAILVDGDAFKWLRQKDHGSVLAYLSRLMEQPGSKAKAMETQVSMVQTEKLDKFKGSALYREMSDPKLWSPDAVRAAIHLGNWDLAAAPWGPRGAEYLNTNHGDGLYLVHAFAKLMASHGVRQPNGALVLGSTGNTETPMQNFGRWANRHLSKAVNGKRAGNEIKASFASIGSKVDHPKLAGKVVVLDDPVKEGTAGDHTFIDTGSLLL